MIEYLSVEHIIAFNNDILGVQNQIHDITMLESAVARPMASAFGEDAYPTLIEKAAALLHSLVLNHPFVDGNKRTATMATVVFLGLNGVVINLNNPEALEFIVSIAKGEVSVEEIGIFLQHHTTPISPVDD